MRVSMAVNKPLMADSHSNSTEGFADLQYMPRHLQQQRIRRCLAWAAKLLCLIDDTLIQIRPQDDNVRTT